jgi:hypothetical protein
MTEQTMRNQFLTVYDKCADDIFTYCYEKIAHREIAKYLTRNIFMRTWEVVSSSKANVAHIEKTLFRTAKDHIKGFLDQKQSQMNYRENLWNLTLSQ